jgi:peptide/nickel transport system permease protein
VLATKERVYVEAAVSSSSPPWRIVLRHVIPSSIQPVVMQATSMPGPPVIAEVSLS